MKRWLTGAALALMLSGCVVAPQGGPGQHGGKHVGGPPGHQHGGKHAGPGHHGHGGGHHPGRRGNKHERR